MKLQTVQMFIPAVFCGFISLMAMFMGESAKPAFYAFLPMCFFFGALPFAALNKRVADLEKRLEDMN